MSWPNFRRAYETAREHGLLLPIAFLATVVVCAWFLILAAWSWVAETSRDVPWQDGAIALGQSVAIAAVVVLFALGMSVVFAAAMGGAR